MADSYKPDMKDPGAIAEAAIRALDCDAEEAEIVRRACERPLGRFEVVAAVTGRSLRLGVIGPAGRGKSTAIRGLSEALVARGYQGLASVEIDHDSAGAGGSLRRIPVSLSTPQVDEEALLADEASVDRAIRKAAGVARKASMAAVRRGLLKGGVLMRSSAANGVVLESLSSWWKAYRDQVELEFPDDEGDAHGQRRGQAYAAAWKPAQLAFTQTLDAETAWAVRGPIFGAIVCHTVAATDSAGNFTRWKLNTGRRLGEDFLGAADYVVGFGVDTKHPPEVSYPPKGGFYARYEMADFAQAKGRIDGDEERAALEPLRKADLASAMLAVYTLRRRRSLEKIAAEVK